MWRPSSKRHSNVSGGGTDDAIPHVHVCAGPDCQPGGVLPPAGALGPLSLGWPLRCLKCQGLLVKDRTPCESPHWYYCVNCSKRVLIRPTDGVPTMITVAVGSGRIRSQSPQPAAKKRTYWPPKSEAAKVKVSDAMRRWHEKQRRIKAAIKADAEQSALPVKNGFASLFVNTQKKDELVLKVTEIAGDAPADKRTATAFLSVRQLDSITRQAGFRLVRSA